MSNIIPFGKYKGQPIEAIAHDAEYLKWLQGQAWFRDRYGNLNTIIVNNFAAPSETPQHNKLQALFTEDDFVYGMTRIVYDLLKIEDKNRISDTQVIYEFNGFDVHIKERANDYKTTLLIEIKPELSDDYPAVIRQIKEREYFTYVGYMGRDIKQQLQGVRVLMIERYTGIGATFSQVNKIFNSSGILIILVKDIKRAILPGTVDPSLEEDPF